MHNMRITIIYFKVIYSTLFRFLRDYHQGVYASSNCV